MGKQKKQPAVKESRAKLAISAIDRAICEAVRGFSNEEYLEVMEEVATVCETAATCLREEHPELGN